MTRSNFAGCSMGRSAGLAPVRILPTKVAARRELPRQVHSIRHQTSEFYRLPISEAAWQPSPGRKVHDKSAIGVRRPTPRDEERLGPRVAEQREGLGVLVGCVFGQHQRYAQGLRGGPHALSPWGFPVLVFLRSEE